MGRSRRPPLAARQLTLDGRPLFVPGPGVLLSAAGAALVLELLERYERADGFQAKSGLAADVRTACEQAIHHAPLGHPDVRPEPGLLDSSTWISPAEVAGIVGLSERHCRRLIDQEAFGTSRQRGRRKYVRRVAVERFVIGRSAAS